MSHDFAEQFFCFSPMPCLEAADLVETILQLFEEATFIIVHRTFVLFATVSLRRPTNQRSIALYATVHLFGYYAQLVSF